jgi:hypothetical protein
MPDKICFIEKTSLDRLALNGGLIIALGKRCCRNHAACARAQQAQVRHESTIASACFPQSGMVGRRKMFPRRHCERSEAIQNLSAEEVSQ